MNSERSQIKLKERAVMEDLITNSNDEDIMWKSGTNEINLDPLLPANEEDVAGLQREIEKEIIPPKVVDDKGYFE